MNTKLTISAALVLFGTCGLAAGLTAADPDGLLGGPAAKEAQPERKAKADRRRGQQRGEQMRKAAFLEKFDADGDGELSDAEKATAKEAMQAHRAERRAAMEARLLPRFDDNNNGVLDDSEWATIKEIVGPMMKDRGERAQRAKKHMKKLAVERFDADGDGELNEAEKAAAKAHFEQRKAAMIERFDADGDGKLTGEERKAAHQHHRERRMLDVNRDGSIDELDAQAVTERFAAGERVPDVNRDGSQNAADVAELLQRIGSFED